MLNNQVDEVRPFARVMAEEISKDEAELIAKKGLFHTIKSGGVYPNDLPDFGA